MNIYIYKGVDGLTGNYHDGGGLVIVTDRSPLDAYNDHAAKVSEYEALAIEKLPAPDNVINAVTTTERVYVFPDAGCC